MKKELLATLVTGIIIATAPAHAAHPLVSDDPDTQGRQNWQAEISTDHTRQRAGGASSWERGIDATLTRGITDSVDVAVTLPWIHVSGAGTPGVSGIGDSALTVKWRLYENEAGWAFGLRSELLLPTGSWRKGLGNGRTGAAITALSSYEYGPWTWLANAGVTYNNNRLGDRKRLWSISSAVLYDLDERWTLAVNLGVERAPGPGTPNEKFGLVGVIYHATPDLDLDAGWRRNWSNGAPANTFGIGITRRW